MYDFTSCAVVYIKKCQAFSGDTKLLRSNEQNYNFFWKYADKY